MKKSHRAMRTLAQNDEGAASHSSWSFHACSSAIWLADELRFDEDIDTNLARRPRSCFEAISNFPEFYRRDGG